MKQLIPINATKDGTAPTITEHYHKAGGRDFMPRVGINGNKPEMAILEIGTDVANCLTSVQKDSTMVEPSIVGYARDNKGNVQSYHEREAAGTLHASSGQGGNTDQFVKEPCGCYDNQFGEFAREPLEGMVRTLKSDHHNAVLLKYRIRKLTPREVYRLQDVDDADIDRLFACRMKQTLKNGSVKEKPIPKSRHYALAGNSITVSPLYFIFRNMFIPEFMTKPKSKQMTLFDDL